MGRGGRGGVRTGEALGAHRQAQRGGGDRAGGRADRDRARGEEAPGGGRAERDQGGGGGGHRHRRRLPPAEARRLRGRHPAHAGQRRAARGGGDRQEGPELPSQAGGQQRRHERL